MESNYVCMKIDLLLIRSDRLFSYQIRAGAITSFFTSFTYVYFLLTFSPILCTCSRPFSFCFLSKYPKEKAKPLPNPDPLATTSPTFCSPKNIFLASMFKILYKISCYDQSTVQSCMYQQQYSIMEEESYQQGRFVASAFEENRPGRRGVDQTGLKAVAWYIKRLLDCCEKISLMDLNNILFGILCENMNHQQDANHLEVFDINTQALEYLFNKYGEESAEELLPVQAVKNLRRRLYDVLNVLIAADVVKKDQKNVGLSQSILNTNMHSILSSQDDRKKHREELRKKINKKNRALARKKKELKQIAKVYIQTAQLIKANRGEYAQEAQQKLALPLALISLLPGSKLQLEESRILIESHRTMQITTETDMMDILHPITKGEISNLLENKRN